MTIHIVITGALRAPNSTFGVVHIPYNYLLTCQMKVTIAGDSRLESRRVQEEVGELDSHEEASPEEIKSREVVLGYRERVGLLLLQLFPNDGATDIVFVTILHSSWDSNCVVRWSLRNAGQILP